MGEGKKINSIIFNLQKKYPRIDFEKMKEAWIKYLDEEIEKYNEYRLMIKILTSERDNYIKIKNEVTWLPLSTTRDCYELVFFYLRFHRDSFYENGGAKIAMIGLGYEITDPKETLLKFFEFKNYFDKLDKPILPQNKSSMFVTLADGTTAQAAEANAPIRR